MEVGDPGNQVIAFWTSPHVPGVACEDKYFFTTGIGEVSHLPVVKKYLSSHATPGTWGEVQNAITWSLSMHINKELIVCSLFASMSLLEAKL